MSKVLRYVVLSVAIVTGMMGTALPSIGNAATTPDSFADLAETLLPAVVNISTTQSIAVREGMPDLPELQFPPGTPFEDFFRDFMEKNGGQGGNKPLKRKATSLGSGFVIDPSGYIVTNYHVIQDADEIKVILQDDTNLSAKVVGRDKKTDLAVLKVEPAKPLTAVKWGDSDKIRVGDWIVAIGNPFGLGGTVTAGIISARARDINSGPYDDYLQTDAPINRGNSGGPMFNMAGEVIGVNAAIFSPSGGSVGIGFAIPSVLAKGVVEQLKATGKTKRGWLGVRVQTVTPEIAESLGTGKARGALVAGITPKSPAEKIELRTGDVIIKFDDKEIPDMHRLPRVVAEAEVGKKVPLTIIRDGREKILDVMVAELDTSADDENENAEIEKTTPNTMAGVVKVEELGVRVAVLNGTLQQRYELDQSSRGLVVVAVEPDSPAAENGIQSGDVIAEAGRQLAVSTSVLSELAQKAAQSGKPLLLLLDRKGEMRFVAVDVGKKK